VDPKAGFQSHHQRRKTAAKPNAEYDITIPDGSRQPGEPLDVVLIAHYFAGNKYPATDKKTTPAYGGVIRNKNLT